MSSGCKVCTYTTHTRAHTHTHRPSGRLLSLPLAGDEIRALQKSLVDYSYQMSQLHQQLATADRQRSTMQTKILSSERMQQQVSHAGYVHYSSFSFVQQEFINCPSSPPLLLPPPPLSLSLSLPSDERAFDRRNQLSPNTQSTVCRTTGKR